MQYWLIKSEPETWSWSQQIARGDKGEPWDGVRNYQANNYMKAMELGDLAFFYHSVKEKKIVGIVEVIKLHYPDPTDASGRFGRVDVAAREELVNPISLADIKAVAAFADLPLLKQSRLSVQPMPHGAWQAILDMAGGTKAI